MKKISQLEKNVLLAKQQEKVDNLETLEKAAIKYNADNKDMVIYDLKRAKDNLKELKNL